MRKKQACEFRENSHSLRTSFALLSKLSNGRLWRCFGHIDWAAHKLGVCFGLTYAIQSVHRQNLGRGVPYLLTGGPFCHLGAPAGQESPRGNRALRHGALPDQIGLTVAVVDLTDGHGADGSVTPLILIGRNRCVFLPSLPSHVVGNLVIHVSLKAELRSQRTHLVSWEDIAVKWRRISRATKQEDRVKNVELATLLKI